MKSTVKTILILVLAILLTFSTTFMLFTFGLLDCWSMNDLRELIARDILLDELSNVEISKPEDESTSDTTALETEDEDESKAPQISTTPEISPDSEEEIEPLCIWNMNGIKITCLYLDDEALFGTVIKFQIENNTDKNIRVRIDNVTVEGYTLSLYGWNCTASANRVAIEELTLLSTELEECGIQDITTIELDFVIIDTDKYSTIQETPTIRITFE